MASAVRLKDSMRWNEQRMLELEESRKEWLEKRNIPYIKPRELN